MHTNLLYCYITLLGEPFSGLVTIESTAMLVSTAVRVTAINCAGQTADLEVNFEHDYRFY